MVPPSVVNGRRKKTKKEKSPGDVQKACINRRPISACRRNFERGVRIFVLSFDQMKLVAQIEILQDGSTATRSMSLLGLVFRKDGHAGLPERHGRNPRIERT